MTTLISVLIAVSLLSVLMASISLDECVRLARRLSALEGQQLQAHETREAA